MDAAEREEERRAQRVLAFAFDPQARPYQAAREVWGLPVVFRVLDGDQLMEANALADSLPSPAAAALMRAVQYVARAVVSIDGDEVTEDLPWRVGYVASRPADLIGALGDAYEAVRKEYAAWMEGDALPNSSGAAGAVGPS